jgi:AcrR family transcriptional regulator
MSQQVKSLQARRTQKLLREALIELIEEQGFDKITVQELVGRAMVSRATFYRAYQDKYDLVEQIFAEAMEDLFNAVSDPETEHPPHNWVKFFEHIADYERLYGALLGRQGSPWFVLKMRGVLADLVKEYQKLPVWQQSADQPIYPDEDEFVPDLVATMFVEAVTWWLEQSRPYTPQQMTERCVSLASAIFKETSTWE